MMNKKKSLRDAATLSFVFDKKIKEVSWGRISHADLFKWMKGEFINEINKIGELSEDPRRISIQDIDLSPRAYNSLMFSANEVKKGRKWPDLKNLQEEFGSHSLGFIAAIGRKRLLSQHNVGRTTIREVSEIMDYFAIEFE